nr:MULTISPECIES: hypothetical protein [unclassified Fusibacter]
MYGGILCAEDRAIDNPYYQLAKVKPSPLSAAFDLDYFMEMAACDQQQKKSLKGLLATEQSIPGLGNGVLQDILFNAKLHPKRKVNTLSIGEKERLFHSIKTTLLEMVSMGGRNSEKDLYGDVCGYQTKLSSKTVKQPCSLCGGVIVKAAYMGGSIYYCETCQKI